MSVFRQKRIEINQCSNFIWNAIGNTCDHHAAVGMAGEHDVFKLLEVKDVKNIADMQAEVDRDPGEM